MERLNGSTLLSYTRMVKVFSPDEVWQKMKAIQLEDGVAMEETFKFLEDL